MMSLRIPCIAGWIFLFLTSFSVSAQRFSFPDYAEVDSLYKKLTPEQRIAQLIIVGAYSNPDQYNLPELERLVRDYQIGGLCFFKGSPMKQVNMQNRLQELSSIPLLITLDGEWGLSMRLDSTVKYPRQMALASFDNDSLLYAMGKEIARQCQRMGIHVNFAPVADINNNPNNPVINDRSWGENKLQVTRNSWLYMKGMQEQGLLTSLKHFPGHGDTETDSHYDLPMLSLPYERLDSLELYPFRALIDSGANGVMVAHLLVTTFDPLPRQASSISSRIIRYKLKDSLGFKGLIFTDALNMKGVSKYNPNGSLEVKALQAGNDMLVMPDNVPVAISAIRQALDSCWIDSVEFEKSVKKVLAAKYYVQAWKNRYVDTSGLLRDLNNSPALLLREKLSEKVITIAKRHKKDLPLYGQEQKIACLAIGDNAWNAFHKQMNQYGRYDYFGIQREASATEFDLLLSYLKAEEYDRVVISIHNTNRLKSKMFGLSKSAVELIRSLQKSQEVILVSFGIPYNLQYFKDLNNVVIAYQDIDIHMEKAAQVLHGVIPAEGKLPVTVNSEYAYGQGLSQTALFPKLTYSIPEVVGLKSIDFLKIDSVIENAISTGAFPGCQVLVAKDRQVIYNKSFGHHTYDKREPVLTSDIYDVASVTKIMATTLAVMHLYDHEKINLDKKASYYLKDLRKTNKSEITVRQLLTHTAGLQSWIPFYKNTLDSQVFHSYYSSCYSEEYPLPVANNLFANPAIRDSVWKWILESSVKKEDIGRKYLYSDLSFLILQKMVEEITDQTLDHYLEKEIYSKLNLANTAFLPKTHFPVSRIVPTEKDTVFRQQQLRGFVHDPAAAMLGGVAGHAGLFSNAGDLAILMQLLLDNGSYGGVTLFKPETVHTFTHYDNSAICRRGLGFDKPEPNPTKGNPCSDCASPFSYGHSGFTGTFVWADPQTDLVYIFLSNRVYPDAANNRITQLSIRTVIQDILYQIVSPQHPCKR